MILQFQIYLRKNFRLKHHPEFDGQIHSHMASPHVGLERLIITLSKLLTYTLKVRIRSHYSTVLLTELPFTAYFQIPVRLFLFQRERHFRTKYYFEREESTKYRLSYKDICSINLIIARIRTNFYEYNENHLITSINLYTYLKDGEFGRRNFPSGQSGQNK